ncbi:zinc ribbon-containing protein [Pantoea anthophila]|uniref:zinc ribbon-containing protein n=1 Tax=Pantoea anthophila TaxID=470931 RepID=UPI0027817F82|nr:zinc ribbon-containing protein [Pantoea anthophila]MDQ1211912.1 putative Zn-ribbon and HTH transcriptional regulator [Pantoea anthophila]
MNKVAQEYRESLAVLTDRLRQGDRNPDALIDGRRSQLLARNDMTEEEIEQVLRAVRRDLEEFARSYSDVEEPVADSLFMRIIRESVWKELADITDKSQLEWREVFQDLHHHGVYQSGEVVGLGNLVCEKCQFTRAIYTPETLSHCPECGHDQFQRQPFEP